MLAGHGSGNRLAAGIGRTAEHAAWSPPLPSQLTPDDPSREDGSDSDKAAAAEGLGWSREQQGPVTMRYSRVTPIPLHDLLDARNGRAWVSRCHRRGDLSRLAS